MAGTKFNLDNLQEIVLDSSIYSAELAGNDVVNSICAPGTVLTASGPVDVTEACGVLANWDRATNLDSVGGHIWREFWTRADDGLLPLPLPLDVPPFWLTHSRPVTR